MFAGKSNGQITVVDSQGSIQHSGIIVQAEGYIDTVSIIRGKIGRSPIKEEDRIIFMKKKSTLSEGAKINTTTTIPFEFITKATEKGQSLLDVYVGV